MSAGTVRIFVERALARQGERVDEAVPSPFDWRALCADTPAMARRLSAGSLEEGDALLDEDDLVPELDLVETAEQTFLNAYLGGLAGLALTSDDERDPESVLEQLLSPLDEEGEARFEALAAQALTTVERALAGQGEALEEASVEGTTMMLTDVAWPSVEVALERLVPFDPERDLELPHAVRQVLSGVARIAAILAVFRWLAGDLPAQGST